MKNSLNIMQQKLFYPFMVYKHWKLTLSRLNKAGQLVAIPGTNIWVPYHPVKSQ